MHIKLCAQPPYNLSVRKNEDVSNIIFLFVLHASTTIRFSGTEYGQNESLRIWCCCCSCCWKKFCWFMHKTHTQYPATDEQKNIEFQMQTMMVDVSFCCCCRIAYKECRLRGELVEPAPKLRDCVLCSERASKRRTIAMARVCCALLESAVK